MLKELYKTIYTSLEESDSVLAAGAIKVMSILDQSEIHELAEEDLGRGNFKSETADELESDILTYLKRRRFKSELQPKSIIDKPTKLKLNSRMATTSTLNVYLYG